MESTVKIKTLLFGAGAGSNCFINNTKTFRDFVGFIDNNTAKVGHYVHGVRVFSPEDIPNLDFDEVVITTQWVAAVKTQLIDVLKVPEAKVILPNKNQLKTKLPFYNSASLSLARNIIASLSDAALAMKIPLVIDFGTLLGIVRDGDLILWDDDIDFSAPFEFASQVEALLVSFTHSNRSLNWFLERTSNKEGYVSSYQLTFADDKNEVTNFVTSIAFRQTKENKSIHMPSLGMWYSPLSHFGSMEMIEWQGQQIQVPWGYKDYLSFQYGDWRIPKKDIKLTDYANLQHVEFSDMSDENWTNEYVELN
jgi:lipopolysaccharide cholinephosphotransferase